MEKKRPQTKEDLEARERSIAHGLVGIHLKPEQLRLLFDLADEAGVTPNVLARRWILEKLQVEEQLSDTGHHSEL